MSHIEARPRRRKLVLDFGESPLTPRQIDSIRRQLAREWGPPVPLWMRAIVSRGGKVRVRL